jgi:hypothetical protein
MSEKIARLGIERDNNLMYFIKNGAVWATPRKQKGQPKGKPQMIEDPGVEMDYSKYIYFLDKDGDVARKERASGGGKRRTKKAKVDKPVKMGKPTKNGKPVKMGKPTKNGKPSRRGRVAAAPAPAPSRNGNGNGNGKKSEAQLDAEIAECLAKARGKGIVPEETATTAAAGARKRRHWY